MTTLRFGTGTTIRSFAEYKRWLDTAEGIGFDMLTCGDSQSLWAECFSMMMFAAVHTTKPALAITVSVQLVAGNAPDKATVGYTGDSATHDLVGFGNPTSAAPSTEIKAYGIGVEIPATLNLPCYGTGTVGFLPAPTSASAQTATVEVTYVSIGLTPAG